MYLGPTEAWSRHPRPQARAALEEARDAGWWFEHSERGHAFGRLRCMPPERDPDGTACKVMVLSTSGAADGSDTARVIRDAVRKCPHYLTPPVQPPTPEAAARRASGKLAQTAALVEAAERLVTAHNSAEEAGALLEDALRQLDQGWATDELERRIDELGNPCCPQLARGAEAVGADALTRYTTVSDASTNIRSLLEEDSRQRHR